MAMYCRDSLRFYCNSPKCSRAFRYSYGSVSDGNELRRFYYLGLLYVQNFGVKICVRKQF